MYVLPTKSIYTTREMCSEGEKEMTQARNTGIGISVRVGKYCIGKIINKRFISNKNGKKHMLFSPPAWGIDCKVYDTMIKPLCQDILIIDEAAKEEGKASYYSTVENFDKNKQTIDRGFGRQYILHLNRWS
jgi:hypothetical protein